ncbi:TPA: AbrB/MazE/SpoVT family DNA-binding domain-containing protein [Candidatus Woesearchaeota archaeon]|nr:AbrB/MazE/SpoVT family DNA-binding domain-containing protein [Candidatus Woesearchaeota archaeon]HIH12296.1 AbrB/MazE/SpoVT family DNA-binding domain-containing protein [Candidatus Woesearchaeota archaeon]
MVAETIIKKWGNSLGVVLPKELVDFQHLKENDKVTVFLVKEADLSSSYGALKGKLKMSGQEFKNMVRKGWEP